MPRIDFFVLIFYFIFSHFLYCLYKQVASMAQSHAGGGLIQTLQQNVDAEPVPLKRKKKDSGAPARKRV